MKNFVKIFFLINIFVLLKANAQDYFITFSGAGASNTVSTVKVENLTKNTSLILGGSDILHLTVLTGINSTNDNFSAELKIYPNPMSESSTLEIYAPVEGDAIITVLDVTGKSVAQIQIYLENFRQDFRLSGLKNGFYLINVKGNNYQFSGKLVSNRKLGGKINIERINSIVQTVDEKAEKKSSKGTLVTVDMAYSTGDRLKFTGTSGNCSTVVIDIPTSSKTITYNFIPCSDGDNNNYPVVEIGTTFWMEENLKTTKYNNNTPIPLVSINTEWVALITPGFCWYNNDEATYKAAYGALYNWYTVDATSTDHKNLCPTGWHVPTSAEWATLTTYLGGESVAGGKLKENGTKNWLSPNIGATNESGFTALPVGIRGNDGVFHYLGYTRNWLNSTESSTTNTNSVGLDHSATNAFIYSGDDKRDGFSVRCLLGEPIIIPTVPVLNTTSVTGITISTAFSGGNITSDGGATITSRGVCWSTANGPTKENNITSDGTGIGSFTSALTGLTAGTTYYVRAYAINSAGTAYGNEVTFTTSIYLPALTTTPVTAITSTTASSGGNITSNGGSAITARGVCWNTTTSPTTANNITSNGTGIGSFTSAITGLTAGTIYYVRAYATSSVGTSYGNEISFTTTPATFPNCGTVTDIDGNVYNTVTIGTQCWMAENLKTTKYNNGELIGTTTPSGLDIRGAISPKYQWAYDGNEVLGATRGRLYTWFPINDSRGICPTGWHVPSTAEWTTLTDYLGGLSMSGGKLKEAGFIYWQSPNTGATNETGFTALPGGYRFSSGGFGGLGTDGLWWSSTEVNTTDAWTLGMGNAYIEAYGGNNGKNSGYSVRCIRGERALPTITTSAVTSVTQTTATCGGNIISDGFSNVTGRGVCWSTSSNPTYADSYTTDGSGTGSFSSAITLLTANTIYHVRAYAINEVGIAYGNDFSFETAHTPPTVTTTAVTNTTTTTASSGGNVLLQGGENVTAKGVCWNTSGTPTISDSYTTNGIGLGSFTSSITGLRANTTYYVRAYATNSLGTSYGEEMIFKTYTATVTDVDGNVYNTVTIGTQVWMAENLKTTKYADGTVITSGTTISYIGYTDKYYFIYQNDPNYKNTYGVLYSWAAATNGISSSTNPSGVQGVCPTGWHVPSNAEKTQLITYLGGSDVAGGKLKEIGTTHWQSPNTGATNESGFTGLGTGGFYYQSAYRYNYMLIGQGGWIWTATEGTNITSAYAINFGYSSNVAAIDNTDNKGDGESVRCVKD